MATHDLPILNANMMPDSSGDVWMDTVENIITMGTNNDVKAMAVCMEYPTGSDIGFYGKFTVPQNYVDTPMIVIRGILDGNSGTMAFGIKATPGIADNETADVAYETEDLAEADISGWSDEDAYEQIITLTPAAAYSPGDDVYFFFFRDDDQDTTTVVFALTGLLFRYNDA